MGNPIPKCVVCGTPIVKMKKIRVWDGYYLTWRQASYCSAKCSQRAYRRRKKAERLARVFGDR